MSARKLFATAVHTLTALGYVKQKGVHWASSDLIAQSVNTNAVVIRNLIRSLKRAGLVKSKEGKFGGVTLAKSPTQISLYEIFVAVEESGMLGLNSKPALKSCPVSCGMKRILPLIFNDVDKAVAKSLKGKTLQDVIDQV